MRIAVWHDPPPGGAQRSLSEILKRLAQRHTVDIFRLGGASSDATSERAYGLNVEVVPFQTRPHRRFAAYWNDWLTFRGFQDEERLERALAARLDAGGYDVVLVSVLRWGQAPALLRFLRTPAAYFCHEPPRRFYEPWCRPEAGPLDLFERGRLLWRWPARRLLENWVRERDVLHVRSAALVITNSGYTRRRIKEVYGREAHVCYLGVDTERFVPSASPAPSGVLSVGALEPHKGFDFVIEALGRIPGARRPPLTIVGPGGHPRMPLHLQELARRAGVRLTVQTRVADDDLLALYQSNAVFAFGARYEPFGLVALEAMACGLPVVAVNEGGVCESVVNEQTGLLVPRDAAAFAAAVDRLLQQPALRREMAQAARARAVQHWSWADTAAGIERHLEGVAGWGRVLRGEVTAR